MNINKDGTVTLHKHQQKLLREAANLVTVLGKVDPKVVDLKSAVEKYCESEAK